MLKKWNDRYELPEFAFGKEPNIFFKEWLAKFELGSILMPADGEGRNGVFAATQHWKVTAFDQSEQGKIKALDLAKEQQVSIDYVVGDFANLEFKKESFDAIGLIYAHFSASEKAVFHHKLIQYLKPRGIVIFEAFSKAHLKLRELNPKVGGPKDLDMLFSLAEIKSDFQGFEILFLEEKEVELSEGNYHNGKSSVIRFIGRKNDC